MKTNDDLDKDIRYIGVMMEKMLDKKQLILEIVSDMQVNMRQLPTKEDLNELKTDIKVIKAAVTDTSHQVHRLDKRITRLEAAA